MTAFEISLRKALTDTLAQLEAEGHDHAKGYDPQVAEMLTNSYQYGALICFQRLCALLTPATTAQA